MSAIGNFKDDLAHEIVIHRLADGVMLDSQVGVDVEVDINDDPLTSLFLEIVHTHRNGHVKVLQKNAPAVEQPGAATF